MNTITELLNALNALSLDDRTRVVVPYAFPQETVYQAWYDIYRVQYDTANEAVILVDNNENIHTPIVYIYDQYNSQLTVIFKRPADDRKTHNQRHFIRVTALRKYATPHIDIQGPLLLITELDTPSY